MDENNIPDPKWHQRISFIKSAFRVFAGVALISGTVIDAGIYLIIAEVLGIVEELV
jgi:hypothetical protein